MEQIIEQEDISASSDESLFWDNNWFERHPEKVLGERYEVSGRFGMTYGYRGSMEDLKRIDVSLNFPGSVPAFDAPTATIIDASLPQVEATKDDEAAQKFIDSVIAKAKKSKVRHRLSITENPDIRTFEEVFKEYNPGITQQDVRIFVWYKTMQRRPLSRRWARLADPSIPEGNPYELYKFEVDPQEVMEWYQEGKVFYSDGQFVPDFLYLSGNIYQRRGALTRNKAEIIEKYGQAAFDRQEARLNEAFSKHKREQALTLTQGKSQLVILPVSEMAKTFMVSTLEMLGEDQQFNIKAVTARSNPRYGQPDFLNDAGASQYNKETFPELSLYNAFAYWLIKKTPPLKESGITVFDIIRIYLYGIAPRAIKNKDNADDEEIQKEKAQIQKRRSNCQKEGNRLFSIFLSEELVSNDKVRLEYQWNATYNNYVPVNFSRIPVAFTMCRTYKGKPEKLKEEKREAVAFMMNEGTGCLAYDVGVGKTAASIFTISAFLDAGYCRRPFLCVPNQVYKQFISEIKAFAPHIPILEAYNLSGEYVENFFGPNGKIAPVPEGCITVLTYEGLEHIGFNEETQELMLNNLYEILNQGNDLGEGNNKKAEKDQQRLMTRLQTLVGRGLEGGVFNIEDFGFDFACYDEAHAMKKVFTNVRGSIKVTDQGKFTREKIDYKIQSGVPSSRALKGFMLNQYIQKYNHGRNVMMLSATPFTNSPLEIYSMLSMMAYYELVHEGLANLKEFFDTFIDVSSELTINSALRPVIKQVILGFNNIVALQSLVYRFFNYKTGEDVGVPRPNKWVLPLHNKTENGITISLDASEKVETFLTMTPDQKIYMDEIISYVENETPLGFAMQGGEEMDPEDMEPPDEDEVSGEDAENAEDVDVSFLNGDEKRAIRVLKGLNYTRSLALSPYLYKYANLGNPTYKQYVESSPKMVYTMGCIKSVRDYHIAHNETISGQVIYMDRGIKYFELIKEYLVKEVGYEEHEVGIIRSGLPKNGKRSKEYIKNLFNGEVYNENSKMFEPVSDSKRIKVVIGSSTIKEGINLQRYGTVLYNLCLDWNPTDVKQLEGRIWRQGNMFKSVRVVNPLLVDSADIFIFQKLQEKTDRINGIWNRNGNVSVLKLEEFNPEELKYALIRDPVIVATLKIQDEQKGIQGELLAISNDFQTIQNIKSNMNEVNQYFDRAYEQVSEYRDIELTGDKWKDAQKILNAAINIAAKQTDREGKKMVSHSQHYNAKPEEQEKFSDLPPFEYKYWWSHFSVPMRDLKKQVQTFLEPHGIAFNLDSTQAIDEFRDKSNENITRLKEQLEALNSEDNIMRMAQEIEEERAANKLEYKTTEQAIADFSTLNYLLSDSKVTIAPMADMEESCPPMKDGVRLIDPGSLKKLQDCIDRQPQTKQLFYQEGTGYTEERKELHDKIISNLFNGTKCVVKNQSPICVLTGGAPGSGKTTWLKKHAPFLTKKAVFHLDADEIRSKLPEYEGWNAGSTHEETRDIVNEILTHLGDVSCRYDFIYDGTMNSAEKYFSLINRIKGLGYQIFIVFMELPKELSVERALGRYQRSGRYVPMDVINGFYEKLPPPINMPKGKYSLDQLKPLVDGYVVVDSQTQKIVERGGNRLPKDRIYRGNLNLDFAGHRLPDHEKPVADTVEPQPAAEPEMSDKEYIKDQIAALKIAVAYMKGKEKTETMDIIADLKTALKYL